MVRVDDLRMFGDRLLVDPDEKHAVSEGGLVIPDTVLRDNPNYFTMTGIVVRLGDGVWHHTFQCLNCNTLAPQDDGPCPGCQQPLGNKNARIVETAERTAFDVEVGQRVLFNRFAGRQVELLYNWLGPTRQEAIDGHLVDVRSGVMNDAKRFLVMRESEILGIVEGAHRITPGYQAASWGKVTDGLTV